MCRLCLATFTSFGNDTPIHYKSTLVHEVLLRASHGDGGQRDGYGITDMNVISKSTDWYFESVPEWTRQISSAGWVLAHLRKASAGTQRTINEAHPYVFDTQVGRLTAAHNGFFESTKYTGWVNGQPGTDSYRALARLASMIDEAKPEFLSADFLSQWLSEFGEGSHYAVMLHLNDTAYVLRGKTRPMAALPVGNGYLWHTDAAVLRFMRKYIQKQIDLPLEDDVKHLPDNMLATLQLGSTDVHLDQINPVHTKTTHVTNWENSSKTYAGAPIPQSSASARSEGGNSRTNAVELVTTDGYIIAPSVTKPRVAADVVVVPVAQTGLAALVRSQQSNLRRSDEDQGSISTLRARKSRWTAITSKLSPLRKELALLWASHILGYSSTELQLGTFLRYTSPTELVLLDGILFPRTGESDKWVKPLTPTAHMMINWWNHLIKDGADVAVHRVLFGERFFWLDNRYTNLRKPHGDDFDSLLAMRLWTTDVIEKVSNWDYAALNRYLDTEKLRIIIRERMSNASSEVLQ